MSDIFVGIPTDIDWSLYGRLYANIAETVNLIDVAPQAQWSNNVDTTNLFNNSTIPEHGLAGDKEMLLEDGSTQTVLHTHPKWVPQGEIVGKFGSIKLPRGARFEALVGFAKGAEGTDGVEFSVRANETGSPSLGSDKPGIFGQTVVDSVAKTITGELQPLSIDLSPLSGHHVEIELIVKAGASSGKDWAVWAAPRITGLAPEPPAPPKVWDMTVEQLTCLETEDANNDHVRMELWADGEHVTNRYKIMDEDEEEGRFRWEVSETVSFAESCQVLVFDIDDRNADDLLGTVTIGGAVTDAGRGSFTLDGADYRMNFSVVARTNPLSPTVDDAISAFEQSSEPGVWAQLSKADISAGLRDRVNLRARFRQRGSWLCGPAAIIDELIRSNPLRYVHLVSELFEQGVVEVPGGRIKAEPNLRNGPSSFLEDERADGTVRRRELADVDWLLAASMRETGNAVMDISATNRSGQATYASQMKEWTRNILLSLEVERNRTLSRGEIEGVREAEQAVLEGGYAFLLVHSAMLDLEEEAGGRVLPNHWINYLGGLEIDETSERIRFWAFSWGDIARVDITLNHFDNTMFGVVTGTP